MHNPQSWTAEDIRRRRLKVTIAREIFEEDVRDPRVAAAVRGRRRSPGPEALYPWELDQLMRQARERAARAMAVRDILAAAPRLDGGLAAE